MRGLRLSLVATVAALVVLAVTTALAQPAPTSTCPVREPTSDYTASVERRWRRAATSGAAAPARARRPDLRGGAQVPDAADAGGAVGRHDADRERLLLRAVVVPVHPVRLDRVRAARRGRERDHHAAHRTAPSLTIYVGVRQRALRLVRGAAARRRSLAEGYLPILQTSYTDAAGVRYRQESFVGRAYGAYGARSVISFVRLDRRRAARDARRDGAARAVEAARALGARPARARRADAADRQRRRASSSTASCATACPQGDGRRSTPSG